MKIDQKRAALQQLTEQASTKNKINPGYDYVNPGFFFVRLDQNSGPIKTQVLTKTQTIFFWKTQVFEAFVGRSVNKGFPKLRKSCQNSGQKPQNSGF